MASSFGGVAPPKAAHNHTYMAFPYSDIRSSVCVCVGVCVGACVSPPGIPRSVDHPPVLILTQAALYYTVGQASSCTTSLDLISSLYNNFT